MSGNEGSYLPPGWAAATLPMLIGRDGLITDGDWVESKDQDPDGEVRLIQLADVGDCVFRDRSSRFLTTSRANDLGCTFLEPGDILVARMPDPLGRACVFPGLSKPCVTAVDVCIIRPNVVSHAWLMYAINSPEFRAAVAGHQSGSTRKRISKKNLCTIPTTIPPLPEQHRIVEAIESYLTRLGDAVATLERVQHNLKRYRASVLKAAVEGRLVPTEAELARQEGRDYEPASVLLERILKERRRRWIEDAAEKGRAKCEEKARATGKRRTRKDDTKTLEQERANAAKKYKEPESPDTSDLPELPEGWCWATVGQLANVGTGATPKRGDPRYWVGGTVPWVTSAVATQGFVKEPSAFVTEQALAETNLALYPPGTLLVAMYGEGRTRGRCAELGIATTTNQALAALVTDGFSAGARRWLRLFLEFNYDRIRESSSGGVQPNLNLEIVRRIAVPIPPALEQERVALVVDDLLTISTDLEAQLEISLRRCSRLRQSILKWAFEGKLVPQDPNDEPASVLLERIKAERGKMGAESKGNRRSGTKRRAR